MPVLKNAKHELFAQEVAKGTGLEAAYSKAGYKPDSKNAARLTKNDGVRTRIDEILTLAAKRVGATIERTLEEMVRLAYADVGEAVEWKGSTVTLKDSKLLPPHVRAAISEVKQTKDGVAIKFHSKTAALEMLARYFGMSKEKLELTGANGSPLEHRVVVEFVRPSSARSNNSTS
jgi:phage terminase small subunit